jgi:flagellar protein FlaG
MRFETITQENAVAPTTNVTEPPIIEPDDREAIQAIRAINVTELLGWDRELTFAIDRKTHRPMVRIINRETREIIKQIPSKEFVEMIKRLQRGSQNQRVLPMRG